LRICGNRMNPKNSATRVLGDGTLLADRKIKVYAL
jgi:hypothetical protein